MEFTASIGENLQVVIPDHVADTMHLERGKSVVVDIREPLDEKLRAFNAQRFKEVLEEYRGSMREEMLAAGYASVDDLMRDLRPE